MASNNKQRQAYLENQAKLRQLDLHANDETEDHPKPDTTDGHTGKVSGPLHGQDPLRIMWFLWQVARHTLPSLPRRKLQRVQTLSD